MGEVVRFSTDTHGDDRVLHPDKVLDPAKGAYAEVVVIGRDRDGHIQFASSHGRLEALWLVRKGEAMLLSYGEK